MAVDSSRLTPAELTRSELIRRYGDLEGVGAKGSLDHAARLMVERYELSSKALKKVLTGHAQVGPDQRSLGTFARGVLAELRRLTVSRGFAALRWRRSYYAWLFGAIPLSTQERREHREHYEAAQEDAKLPEARADMVLEKLYGGYGDRSFGIRIPGEKRYHMGIYLLSQALRLQIDAVEQLEELSRRNQESGSLGDSDWLSPRAVAERALEEASAIELPERGEPYILLGR